MDTSSKICSCGARFDLQVQLVVHCKQHGHKPHVLTRKTAPRPMAVDRPVAPKSWRKSLVAGLTLVSLVSLTAGFNFTVSKVTSWQGTANVLMMP